MWGFFVFYEDGGEPAKRVVVDPIAQGSAGAVKDRESVSCQCTWMYRCSEGHGVRELPAASTTKALSRSESVLAAKRAYSHEP